MSSKKTQKSRAKRSNARRGARRSRPTRRASRPRAHARAIAAPKVTTRVDGVNVNDLVVMAEQVKNHPAKAEFAFRASTHWLGGAHTRTKIQGFTAAGAEQEARRRSFNVESDEPPALLGADHGPTPMEYALAGLGSSLAAGLAYNAAARGIQLDAVDIDLEAPMDVRGTLGVTEATKGSDGQKELRPGFENIRIVCQIKSDAPPSELKDLLEYTKATSPLLDMFQHPVPIAVELKH